MARPASLTVSCSPNSFHTPTGPKANATYFRVLLWQPSLSVSIIYCLKLRGLKLQPVILSRDLAESQWAWLCCSSAGFSWAHSPQWLHLAAGLAGRRQPRSSNPQLLLLWARLPLSSSWFLLLQYVRLGFLRAWWSQYSKEWGQKLQGLLRTSLGCHQSHFHHSLIVKVSHEIGPDSRGEKMGCTSRCRRECEMGLIAHNLPQGLPSSQACVYSHVEWEWLAEFGILCIAGWWWN